MSMFYKSLADNTSLLRRFSSFQFFISRVNEPIHRDWNPFFEMRMLVQFVAISLLTVLVDQTRFFKSAMVWGQNQANNVTDGWTNNTINSTGAFDNSGNWQNGSNALVITIIVLGCVAGLVVVAAVIKSLCLRDED